MLSFSKNVDVSIDPTMELTDDNYEAIIHHLIELDVIDLSHFCNPKVKKVKLSRLNHNRSTSLWTSSWGRMLSDPALRVHKSWENLKFRRRFRMPYEAFIPFVDECRNCNIFDEQYQGKIPIEFKVLACLRNLHVSEVVESQVMVDSLVNVMVHIRDVLQEVVVGQDVQGKSGRGGHLSF